MPIARRDNDWLRLTSDDQRKSRVFDGALRCVDFCWRRRCSERRAARKRPTCPISCAAVCRPERADPELGRLVCRRRGRTTPAASMDFSQSLAGLTNFIFVTACSKSRRRELSPLEQGHPQGTGFGGFVGRNCQWDDVVFGVEPTTTTLTASRVRPPYHRADSISFRRLFRPRTTPRGQYADRHGRGAGQGRDHFRGRAGWATGDFLPYIFGGVAVGRMDVSVRVE